MVNCKILRNAGGYILRNAGGVILRNDDTCVEPSFGRKFKVRSPIRLQTQQILVTKTKPFSIKSKLVSGQEVDFVLKSKLFARQKTAISIQSRLKNILIKSLRIKSKLTARTVFDAAITSRLSLPLDSKLTIKGIKDYSRVDRLLTLLGLLE